MGMRINTNVASIGAQRSLKMVSRDKGISTSKMSSGERITRAADDSAGLAISEKLKSHIRSSQQANRNANDGISYVQVAEGGLNEVQGILTRLRELSVQSASDTVGESERGFINTEYQQLKQEVDRIAEVTTFNGVRLLDGQGGKLDFQVGIFNGEKTDRISYESSKVNAKLETLGIHDIDVSSKVGAQESLENIDKAITRVSGSRSELGALQNRLVSTTNNLETSIENMSSSNSRIRDLDYAVESSNSARLNILEAAGTSVLAQANMSPQSALKLLA
ncbi:MAG: flagellin [Bacteriovoracaceae bacterium]|nr:flagellin [Bacteriovoracaceae bacterium]